MSSADLLTYIVTQEHAGFSDPQIRAALLANGYSEKDVNDAFTKLGPSRATAQAHDDAQQYARQGMSGPQAFASLAQQGHEPAVARKAVRDVFGVVPGGSEHSHTVVFIIIAIALGAGGMYLLMGAHGSGPNTGTGSVVPVVAYSPSEIIAQSLSATQNDGKEAGISSCTQQLVGDDRERCLAAIAAATRDVQVCSQIASAEIKDGCLLYFIDTHFDEVCSSVQLVRSKDTCETLRGLRGA